MVPYGTRASSSSAPIKTWLKKIFLPWLVIKDLNAEVFQLRVVIGEQARHFETLRGQHGRAADQRTTHDDDTDRQP